MSPLRFLVDVNVGVAVADSLREAGHDVAFAGDIDWHMTDRDMIALAHTERRILVTMDNDFGELVFQAGRRHAGVLLLRMPGAGRAEKVAVVLQIASRYGDRLVDHLCVYRQGRLRVRD